MGQPKSSGHEPLNLRLCQISLLAFQHATVSLQATRTREGACHNDAFPDPHLERKSLHEPKAIRSKVGLLDSKKHFTSLHYLSIPTSGLTGARGSSGQKKCINERFDL